MQPRKFDTKSIHTTTVGEQVRLMRLSKTHMKNSSNDVRVIKILTMTKLNKQQSILS